jgi:DNA-binding MarR family transcriptional regulator
MTPQYARAFLATVAGCGIPFTIGELRVFLAVPAHHEPTAISITDLTATLKMGKPSITRAVNFLVKHDLVTRPRSKLDQRLVVLNRTISGDQILRELCHAH